MAQSSRIKANCRRNLNTAGGLSWEIKAHADFLSQPRTYTYVRAGHCDTRLRRKTPYKWSLGTFMDLSDILSKSFLAFLTHNFGQFEKA